MMVCQQSTCAECSFPFPVDQFIVVHSLHVLLNDGLQCVLHFLQRVLRHAVFHVFLHQRVGAETVGMEYIGAVELYEVVALQQLVDATGRNVVYGYLVFSRGVEYFLLLS